MVAKLPFEAGWPMKGSTHSSLEGDDYTDCSMAFIYWMGSMVFRQIVQKALGFSLPRAGKALQIVG